MKMPKSTFNKKGEWRPAIAYTQIDKYKYQSGQGVHQNHTLFTFVREQEDFEDKFILQNEGHIN